MIWLLILLSRNTILGAVAQRIVAMEKPTVGRRASLTMPMGSMNSTGSMKGIDSMAEEPRQGRSRAMAMSWDG